MSPQTTMSPPTAAVLVRTPTHTTTHPSFTIPFLLLFLLSAPGTVRAQSPDPADGVNGTAVRNTSAPPTDDTCAKQPSPVTINTYGGCAAGPAELASLKTALDELTKKVQQLDGYVKAFASRDTCASSRDASPQPLLELSDSRFIDCSDHYANGSRTDGAYEVWPLGLPRPIAVRCEFHHNDGYTVLQQRTSARVPFQRNWQQYQNGFGNSRSGTDFWLGLDNIYALTSKRECKLRIDLLDWQENRRVAVYDSFQIGPETDRYRLKTFFFNEDASTAGDSISNYHNFLPFSTFDRDNDYAAQNCAAEHGGGWWYRDCDNAQLNGVWSAEMVDRNGVNDRPEWGIEWDSWRRMYSLRGAKMSIAPRWPRT